MNNTIAELKKMFLKRYGITENTNQDDALEIALTSGYSTASSRISTYSPNISKQEKNLIHQFWKNQLKVLSDKYYNKEQSEDQFFKDIDDLQKNMNRRFPNSFNSNDFRDDPGFRVSHSQKSLSVYLKYLWCLGFIPEPPVCPVDNTMLKKAWDIITADKKKKYKADLAKEGLLKHDICAWGHINNKDEYRIKLKILKDAAQEKGKSLSVWELSEFNQDDNSNKQRKSNKKAKPDQNNVIFPKSKLHVFWTSLQESDSVYKGKTPDTDYYYIKSGKLWMKIIRDGNYNGDKTYQCFSISRKILNDNLLKKLEEEFSVEIQNGAVKADYNDKTKIVYYNCSLSCLNDGKINEKELIRWFNAHAKNLVKIINENK